MVDPDTAERDRPPRIELKQLRYFLAVVDEKNFTRAANRMGTAQPALSQQIRSLERELGARLFDRDQRTVRLTEAGEALVMPARRAISTTLAASRDVRDIATGKKGLLAVSAVASAIYSPVAQYLPLFLNTFPGVEVSICELSVAQQVAGLTNGSIDVGVLRGPYWSAELHCETLFEEQFVIAVNVQHKFAACDAVSVAEIAKERMIGLCASSSNQYADIALRVVNDGKQRLDVAQKAQDTHSLLALVAAGFGVSLVPRSFRNIQLREVRYVPIAEETPTTPLLICWHRANNSLLVSHYIAFMRRLVTGEPWGAA